MSLEDPRRCPTCESRDTESVYSDLRSHEYELVFVCHDCPTQWTVTYHSPHISDIELEE